MPSSTKKAPTVKASAKKQVPFINKTVDKKGLRNLLSGIYEEYGTAKTALLANALKDLGFHYATKGGVTISIEDLTVPEEKKALLQKAEDEIHDATHKFVRGEITEVERYTKVIDTWSQTTEDLTQRVIDNFDRLNPEYMMAYSGDRGNVSQVRQLVGMRGLMADSQGQIIDMPIKTNFREGLSVTEYIISSYGARKGLVDTALKTADSGYLTRRLVDVAQDVIISEKDCGTNNGIPLQAILEGEKVLVTLKDRIVSRTAADNVVNPNTGEVLVEAGQVINLAAGNAIEAAGISEVVVRSALTCETAFGVCQTCYGWSLTTNKRVDIGEAIGIMAAQSIGEPGTQLTMRTFHTGGAVSGSAGRDYIKSPITGVVTKDVPVREYRTRHGENVYITTRDTELVIKGKSGSESIRLPINTTVHTYKKGDEVAKDQVVAEIDAYIARSAARLTEKVTKDLNTVFGGEVFYDGFDADEKRDRQGNITRTANRSGTIWVLGGEVYSLPAGAKHLVKDGQDVKAGAILAESTLISEHGGQVRIPEALKTETIKVGKESVQNIVEGKELTIIIASIEPKNADLEQTKKERLWKTKKADETFVIKAPDKTLVESGSIIAELVDESCVTPTSGQVIYDDVEVDDQRIITKPGTVYFVPEEVHQISKDISLKVPNIETGDFVDAGTEVVKGVVTRIAGIIEFIEENDVIREVIVRPGKRFRVNDVNDLNVDDGAIVEAGTEVAPGITADEKCLVTVNFQMDDPGDELDLDSMEDTSQFEFAEVILRPAQAFFVEPRDLDIAFNTHGSDNLRMVPLTQLQYGNGERVRQIEGASLIRTSLVLQMTGPLEHLRGLVEIANEGKKTQLQIVVLENLLIRHDAANELSATKDATQTHLLVTDGQTIKPQTPLVKTLVLSKTAGQVSLGNATEEGRDVRRILLVTKSHIQTVDAAKSGLKKGDYVREGQSLGGKAVAPASGRVEEVDAKTVTLRTGRPYLIGSGTQLQMENRALIQRGDLLALLIFERQKTGDIVQGLPRVEELLEGRKPKEIAVLAQVGGNFHMKQEDETVKAYLETDNGRQEVTIPVGANILVEDGQYVEAGQPITDGSVNPHELLEISGIVAVRKYLLDEVQKVYRTQGVEIADKHVEVIVRQMSKKVRVEDSGDTTLVPGELLDEKELRAHNVALEKDKTLATGTPLLLGITKASLNTESFISAASFQETTRVLTEAAVSGKKDFLRGLKENVIIGRLIPAGTGFPAFTHAVEEAPRDLTSSSMSRSSSRKPSAILEEIESMFGSPDINEETIGQLLIDDSSISIQGGESDLMDLDDDMDGDDD
ncbi:MAG: DNA-directed RNA polymerase subunit beta'' [Vampirovibrionales bacterium]